jgi:hypothetical protein
MNETVILVGIGLILGLLLSSGVQLVFYVINKAELQLAREKNLIIKAIADESAEADKVLSSVVSKAMNAHALRSALLPKIDKMHKMLTANMHTLDIYFVKYMESQIARYRDSFEGQGQEPPAAAAAGYPADAPPRQPEAAPEEFAVPEMRSRPQPAVHPQNIYRPPAMPQAQPEEETIQVAPRAPLGQRTGPWPGAAKPPVEEQKPAPRPIKMPQPVRPPQPREESFDLERAMAAKVQQKTAMQPGGQLDTRSLSVDHSEKTLQWDRSQLTGAAAPPEAIVVEGSEVTRKAGPPPERKVQPAAGQGAPGAPGAADKSQNSITGEDIENTMDSFFGLGDK